MRWGALAVVLAWLASSAAAQDTVSLGTTGYGAPITPPQITGTQNNYAPSGCHVYIPWRLSSDAARSITGISASCAQTTKSAMRVLVNDGAFEITLEDEHAGSSAANQFQLVQDTILPPGGSVVIVYDPTEQRWRTAGDVTPGVGGAVTYDNLRIEDGDDGGTYTNVTDFAHFDDSGDINYTLGGVPPNETVTGAVRSDQITYAKMQELSAGSLLLGRGDGGAGNPQEISLGTNLSITGTTLNATGGGSLTVEDIDANPTYAGITKLSFDQADGFAITNPVAGEAQLDVPALASLAALNTQLGSSIADGAHTPDQVDTLNNTELCQSDGFLVQCNIADLDELNVALGSSIADGPHTTPLDAWPVGSVFISVVSTNPNTLLGGGTWSAIGAGRVLVGLDSGDTDFDTVEETGGSKTVASAGSNAAEAAHTHDYTQTVNHVHVIAAGQGSHQHGMAEGTTDGAGVLMDRSNAAAAAAAVTDLATLPEMGTNNPTGGVATGTTAAGASHNHAFTGSATSVVQPYLVVYMWKRTAALGWQWTSSTTT